MDTGAKTSAYPNPRSEERQSVAGQLTLRLSDPARSIQGELIDASRRGFRLKHSAAELVPGKRVQVVYPWGNVWARVVWSSPDGAEYQSGFEMGPGPQTA